MMIKWLSDTWLTFETGMRDRLSAWLCHASLRVWGYDDSDGWNSDIVIPIKVDSDIKRAAKRLGVEI